MNQNEKAAKFRKLHIKGNPLILYNIWDAGTARALTKAGAKACATGSMSVAAAQGYKDGEDIPLDFLLRIAQRIANSTDLPVSIDFEGAYATSPKEVQNNVSQMIKTGAVGINFEDRIVAGEGLYSISAQAARIQAARLAADQLGVALFINARTDLFHNADPTTQERLVEGAIERAAAYSDAGADGFFVPWLTQPHLIKRVVDAVRLPVNVMMRGDLGSLRQVADLGVARASFGPSPYFQSLADLTENFKAVS